jgi:hypothetical protein
MVPLLVEYISKLFWRSLDGLIDFSFFIFQFKGSGVDNFTCRVGAIPLARLPLPIMLPVPSSSTVGAVGAANLPQIGPRWGANSILKKVFLYQFVLFLDQF